jgi:hypothetical protein
MHSFVGKIPRTYKERIYPAVLEYGPALTQSERDEREDLAVGACCLTRDRFLTECGRRASLLLFSAR